MADIFISYARADRDRIEKLASALEGEGYSVWWDRQLVGGAEFAATIETELDASKTVIVAWSEHSIGSHWVRDEAGYAQSNGKLLPITLDGSMPPLGFRQLHALDIKDWNGDADDAAIAGIVSALGGKTPAKSATADAVQPLPQSGKGAITRPGIAVLPFANMSTDEEIEFLADGLTEDIITTLSHNRHLSVPARTSVFAYKGQSTDIREAGKALGVRYIVEGSVRKMGKRARVTVQLIEVETGAHIWAKKFDSQLDELYETPDDIVEKISGSLFAQLTWFEADRTEKLPADELGPWEYCMRTAANIGRAAGSMRIFEKFNAEMQQAIAGAPNYALAHAIYAWGLNARIINGSYEDHELSDIVAQAKTHLRKARELANDDQLTLTYIGATENYAGLQDRAAHTLEGVLKRNPSNAEAWYIICQVYTYQGRYDEAREAIGRASALAPEAGFAPLHDWYRGINEYSAGNFEIATPLIERHVTQMPDYGYANVIAAICASVLGDEAKAARYIAKAKQTNPQLKPQKLAGMILSQHDKEKSKREYALLEKLWAETA